MTLIYKKYKKTNEWFNISDAKNRPLFIDIVDNFTIEIIDFLLSFEKIDNYIDTIVTKNSYIFLIIFITSDLLNTKVYIDNMIYSHIQNY